MAKANKKKGSNGRVSAGLLMYRLCRGELEVFLAHPGGPHFARKDEGHWTAPKGETEPGEALLDTAKREFFEETNLTPKGPYIELGWIRQKGGKVVHAWAFEGDLGSKDVVRSIEFQMEWPPKSGKMAHFPEVDRAEFFHWREASVKIKPTQIPFIDRLREALLTTDPETKP